MDTESDDKFPNSRQIIGDMELNNIIFYFPCFEIINYPILFRQYLISDV
jgi:hypothetical protein